MALTHVRRAGQAMLERAGVRMMLNELSSTVVFERPTEEAFVRKWQLACQARGLRQGHRACCGAAARRLPGGFTWGVYEGARRRRHGRMPEAVLRVRDVSEMHPKGAWRHGQCEMLACASEAGATRSPSAAGAQDDIAHVVVMPNVTLSTLEGFVADLIASRARAATTAALRVAADARAVRDDELRGASDDDC